jgi:hypothetical protein
MQNSLVVEYAEERFRIVSNGDVDLASVVALVSPGFVVIDDPGEVTCEVELRVDRFDRSWYTADKPWRLPPLLQVDHDGGAALRILRYSAEHKTIFRYTEEGCAELQLDVPRGNRKWLLTVEEADAYGVRAIARMFKQLVGFCVMRKGAAIFHASAVRIGDINYVFYGPRGSGKSSFMLRCCVDLGAQLVSDDLLIAWTDSMGRLRVSGWPRRIGISLSAFDPQLEARVAACELRREQTLGTDWRQNIGLHYPPAERKRLLFDMDEFMSVFGVEYTDRQGPIRFVRLNYNTTVPGAKSIAPLEHVYGDDSYLNAKLLKYFSDYLSLGPETSATADEIRFEDISGHGNLYTLEYGADFFGDFASNWRAIESSLPT